MSQCLHSFFFYSVTCSIYIFSLFHYYIWLGAFMTPFLLVVLSTEVDSLITVAPYDRKEKVKALCYFCKCFQISMLSSIEVPGK